MMLKDLDEVTRLARQRARLVVELEELRHAETMMLEVTGPMTAGTLKVSFIKKAHPETHPEEVFFEAVVDVLVLGYTARITAIDDRLADLKVTP